MRNPALAPGTMLGAGGNLVVPKSESAELSKAIADIERALPQMVARDTEGIKYARSLLSGVLSRLTQLRTQVSQGFHENPLLSIWGANPQGRSGETITDRVLAIEYIHAEDGRLYRHKFAKGVTVIAKDGGQQAVMFRRDGLPVLDEFIVRR